TASGAVTWNVSAPRPNRRIVPAGANQPSPPRPVTTALSVGDAAASQVAFQRNGCEGTSAVPSSSSTTGPDRPASKPSRVTFVGVAAKTSGGVAPSRSASRLALGFQENCSRRLVRDAFTVTTVESRATHSGPAARNAARTLCEFCASKVVANADVAIQKPTASTVATAVARRQAQSTAATERSPVATTT